MDLIRQATNRITPLNTLIDTEAHDTKGFQCRSQIINNRHVLVWWFIRFL
ncbi:MAG: hypothetical protein L6Q38_14550 [Nitrospira sp.]|nr:hypothetical protein [Nitrospira sp.]